MTVHDSDSARPLSCVECGRRFLTNSALACHVKVHQQEEGAGNYDCPICGADFAQISALKDHVHGHSVNGQYDCPQCGKV